MTGRQTILRVLVATLVGMAGVSALAGDDMTPRPQHVFTDKPRIEDYADYNAFLVDIMEYRRQKSEKASRAAAATQSVADAELAGIAGRDLPPAADLYDIKAPETLDDALNRASKLPHPVYTEPERFGRTTSFSFPIPQMDGEDMATNDIPGNLQDLETVNPEVYEDPTATVQALAVLTTNPDNADDARDQQAFEGTDDAYRPSYDIASRVLTDSDGHSVWAPIFIQNEIGYTVINKLDIEVATFKSE